MKKQAIKSPSSPARLNKSAAQLSSSNSQQLITTSDINDHPVNYLGNLPKSFSTADIGLDRNRDEKRAAQMRDLLRSYCQPKSDVSIVNPREQRRKQVDAIYAYLTSHGLSPVPAEYQKKLEEYVFENKRYFAWLPTEPKYLVICEPTPTTESPAVSLHSLMMEMESMGHSNVPTAQQAGKPQGFFAALSDEIYNESVGYEHIPEDPSITLWGSQKLNPGIY